MDMHKYSCSCPTHYKNVPHIFSQVLEDLANVSLYFILRYATTSLVLFNTVVENISCFQDSENRPVPSSFQSNRPEPVCQIQAIFSPIYAEFNQFMVDSGRFRLILADWQHFAEILETSRFSAHWCGLGNIEFVLSGFINPGCFTFVLASSFFTCL